MPKATQLTVSIQNQPGTLASVASVLASSGANIVAFLTGTVGAAGYVQFVADDVERAKKALEGEGISYTEQAVLQADVPNRPGALAEFAGKLAAKGINITSGYATVAGGATSGSVVLSVSDLDAAERI